MSSYAPANTVKYCDFCSGIMSVETTTCPHCLALQTSAGRMIFGRITDGAASASRRPKATADPAPAARS